MDFQKNRAVSITTVTSSVLSIRHEATRKLLSLVKESPTVRRKRMVQLCLMLCIPMIVLFLQCGIIISSALTAKRSAEATATSVTASAQMSEVVTRLQRERGMTSIFLSSNNGPIWDKLQILRASTDAALDAVVIWSGNPALKDEDWLISHSNFRERITRRRIARTSNSTSFQEILWFSETIEGALSIMNRHVILSGDKTGNLWRHVGSLQFFLHAKEHLGMQRAIGSAYFAKGHHTEEESDKFYEVFISAETFLNLCFAHSNRSGTIFESISTDRRNLTAAVLDNMRPEILANQARPANVSKSLEWFANITTYMDRISSIEVDLVTAIKSSLDKELQSVYEEVTEATVLLTVMAIACIGLSTWYWCSASQINQTIEQSANALSSQSTEISTEKRKAEKLLHRMLPPSVADSLKRGCLVPAEYFEAVTVCCLDVVGFTLIASKSTPMQVVTLLNHLYSLFDTETDTHDVYKVETIGDAYVVVSGAPHKNGLSHVDEVASLSLALQGIILKFTVEHLSNEQLKVRIGFHTGPVLSGVVGTKMPRYSLVGEAVTYAVHMEQTSLVNRIQVSQRSQELLSKDGKYELIERSDRLHQKNIERTYWLHGTSKEHRFG